MIRKAKKQDLVNIFPIYEIARKYMEENGNGTQWGGWWPPEDVLQADVEKGDLYVCEENGKIHGVFAFIIGEDSTYQYIQEGEWPNDEEYGTVHRLASDGKAKGIFKEAIDFAKSQIENVRIDTHANNGSMLHLIEKNGFKRCGVILVPDQTERIAFQYVGSSK